VSESPLAGGVSPRRRAGISEIPAARERMMWITGMKGWVRWMEVVGSS